MASIWITLLLSITISANCVYGQYRSSSRQGPPPSSSFSSSSSSGSQGSGQYQSSSSSGQQSGSSSSSSSSDGGPASVFIAVQKGNIINYSNGCSVSTYSDGSSLTVKSDKFGDFSTTNTQGPYVVENSGGSLHQRPLTSADQELINRKEEEIRQSTERMNKNFQDNFSTFNQRMSDMHSGSRSFPRLRPLLPPMRPFNFQSRRYD